MSATQSLWIHLVSNHKQKEDLLLAPQEAWTAPQSKLCLLVPEYFVYFLIMDYSSI